MGAAVAALAVIRPEISGTGQDFVESVLRDEAGLAWWVLIVLAVLKAGATAATLGGKGAGGIFMPSLFIGATAGAGFASVLASVWTISAIDPGAYALVGMAATFAAVARAPLTSILIVFETTGDYGLVLPLMITTAIATLLAGLVRPLSAYTAPLHRMGIHLRENPVTDLLDTVRVGDVITPSSPWVAPETSLGEVQGMLQRHRVHGLPVVDRGRLVGLIAESDITRAGGPSDQVSAGEAMTPNPVTATRDTPVSEALERMGALGVGRLPVVAADDPGRLVGMFRREDAVLAYHRALGTTARASGLPDRLRARTGPGASFFEFEIPPGSPADGRKISEIPWPEGCVVVSVQRGTRLLVPSGPTEVRSGDAVTAFGGEEARRRLVERLEARPPVREDDPDGDRA
jgi:CIC family chloride channel protein